MSHTPPNPADTTVTNTRQGETTGHVRWMLRFSVALAIVAMVGAWAWYSSHSHVTYEADRAPATSSQPS